MIKYLGEVEDVRPVLADSAVFVLQTYREGQPRSMVEAMSMATPVVTTEVHGCHETVTDQINGRLVSARDAPAVAQAMAGFIDAPDTVARMGAASRERVLARFSAYRVNARILGVLRECLE
jgi:glycosyltransferase involved in cell wall biosynthesis